MIEDQTGRHQTMSTDDQRPAAPATPTDGPKERQIAIAEAVIRNGTIGIDQLAKLTGVSTMTIYRDLGILEERGVLQRHRGKVVAVASGLHEAAAEFRLEQSSVEKQGVAHQAAGMIAQGSSVMLDDSTSGIWLLRALPDLSSITVVTNSLLVANDVANAQPAKLVLAGGEYQAWARAFLGPQAVDYIRSMHADFCFLSASGISGLSCFHPYRENVEVKRAMLDSAEVRVLLLDHTKFRRRALYSFAQLDEFDHVFLDAGTPDALVTELRAAGVKITIAPPLP